ncbi:MAG: NlpC/P60 family protein, partial [Candidatus Hydrothermarchaeaceae archaeon]
RNTPHRMGGTTRRGIDCSGLVMVINQKLFGIHLPRTTKAQVKEGVSISRNKLRAGDLIFFRPPGYKRHVGIYLGRGEFLHASSSNGVMISNLNDRYWRRSYWMVRRILPM